MEKKEMYKQYVCIISFFLYIYVWRAPTLLRSGNSSSPRHIMCASAHSSPSSRTCILYIKEHDDEKDLNQIISVIFLSFLYIVG